MGRASQLSPEPQPLDNPQALARLAIALTRCSDSVIVFGRVQFCQGFEGESRLFLPPPDGLNRGLLVDDSHNQPAILGPLAVDEHSE